MSERLRDAFSDFAAKLFQMAKIGVLAGGVVGKNENPAEREAA